MLMSLFEEIKNEGNAAFSDLADTSGFPDLFKNSDDIFNAPFEDTPFPAQASLGTTGLTINSSLNANLAVVLKETNIGFKVKLPNDENKARLYVLKQNLKPVIKKDVTDLPKSGINHTDFKEYLGIGLGENVYNYVKNPAGKYKNKHDLMLQFLTWFNLDIHSTEGYHAASEINKVITEFVVQNPSYKDDEKVTPDFLSFLEMIELGVLDFKNTVDFVANKVFKALANEVRGWKLKDKYWNPKSISEDGKPDYSPIISSPFKVKSSLQAQFKSLEDDLMASLFAKTSDEGKYNDLASNAPKKQIESLNSVASKWIVEIKRLLNYLFNVVTDAITGFLDVYLKTYNAFLVGVINGVIEVIAGLLESVGMLIGLLNYENFKALKEGVTKFIKEADFDSIVQLLKKELVKLFSFLDGDSLYKNAYEFGTLLPRLVEIFLDVFFAAKGAIKLGAKAIEILKDLPGAIKKFAKTAKDIRLKIAKAAISKELRTKLRQHDFDIEVDIEIDSTALGDRLGVQRSGIVADNAAEAIINKGHYLIYNNIRIGYGKTAGEIEELFEKLLKDPKKRDQLYASEKAKVLKRSDNFKKHTNAVDDARKPYLEKPEKIDDDWLANKKIKKQGLGKERALELHETFRKAEYNTGSANVATGKVRAYDNKTGELLYRKDDYLLASGNGTKLPATKEFPNGSINKETIVNRVDKSQRDKYFDTNEGNYRVNDSEHPMLRAMEEDSILVLDKKDLTLDDVRFEIEIESTFIPCQVCSREILLCQQNLGKNASIVVKYPSLDNGKAVKGSIDFNKYIEE